MNTRGRRGARRVYLMGVEYSHAYGQTTVTYRYIAPGEVHRLAITGELTV